MEDNFFITNITGYGYDGEGVARLNGKIVFIPLALRGEVVKGVIREERSSFLRAYPIEIIEKSNLRTDAPCPYFGRCGGCQYQHTTYENELEIKKELMEGQLKKVGFKGKVNIINSPQEYGYRNKIRLFVNEDGLCLKERGSNVLCPIDKCLLVSERMNRAISAINKFLENQNLYSKYENIVIREEGEQLAVVFFCTSRKSDVNYQGIYLILGPNCSIFESYNDVLTNKMGDKALNCEELGLKCQFSPLSFHQVNRFIGEKLYNFVLDNIIGESVANCYSGAGVLSGAIALFKKRVVGIELGEQEHQDSERLREENNLFYLTNLKGDCANVLKTIEEVDTIIVDPPKKGVDEKVSNQLNQKNCKRLIYISCNSATLIRDLQRLKNYKIQSVTLFDMFARTGEYEVVAILSKLKKV